jgi:hypothetical protein
VESEEIPSSWKRVRPPDNWLANRRYAALDAAAKEQERQKLELELELARFADEGCPHGE